MVRKLGALISGGEVSTPGHRASAAKEFDIGIAVVPLRESVPAPRTESRPVADGGIPGYEEALGRGRPHVAERAPFLIEKGEEAVRAATAAIATEIGRATQRIATAIGDQVALSSTAGPFDLESVNLSFGITLAAGVQAMFTAQAESSVQVTITLSRRLAGTDSDTS